MKTTPTSLVAGLAALAGLASAAELTQVTDFGDNPSGAKMFIYVPDNVAAGAAIITMTHYCSGTASAYFGGTQPYVSAADSAGIILIYPESPYEGTCWDVASDTTLTRDGGGNSNAIANMVAYAIETYEADASRVFMVGGSSGAMMTNVLAATYPDVFNAGSVYSGVPAGCFSTGGTPTNPPGWNSQCSGGQSVHTPDEWAQIVYDMYPGYTGAYPRMRINHGEQDTTLAFPNYDETIKQWTAVHGLSQTPDQTQESTPDSGFTTYTYGDSVVVGVVASQYGHNFPNFPEEDLAFFGLI